MSADEASPRIRALVGGMVTVMMHDDITPIARSVVREQMNPTPIFTVLFNGASLSA